MKTKFFRAIVLLITLTLTFLVSSCGKNDDIIETNVPVNQDKVVEEKDTTKDETKKDDKEETTEISPENKPEEKPENKPSSETKKHDESKPTKPVDAPQVPDTPTENTPAPEAPSVTVTPSVQTASAYIGKSTGSLVAAIGQPSGKTYVTSCIGDGEDGEWYYPGFTVYTYRDPNGSEKVIDVLAS